MRAAFALALLIAAPAATQQAAPACTTLDDCLAKLRAHGNRVGNEAVEAAVVGYGDAAVIALLPWLRDPDPRVQDLGGVTLAAFPRIDPRHLPLLVEAYRDGNDGGLDRGNGWMPRAIAATGTDEALALLQRAFLANPDMGSNAQVHFALARFGARAWPFAREQLASCAASEDDNRCGGVLSLIGEFEPRPAWVIPELSAVASSPRVSEGTRRWILWTLTGAHAPEALPLLLEDMRRADGRKENDFDHGLLIERLAAYGKDAISVGPAIAAFLRRADLPDTRVAAAYAVGAIGYRPAIADLAAFTPAEFDADWRLAYNAAESLARLEAKAQRPTIARLTAHWHAPVRNNAERALSLLAGGRFARGTSADDTAPYPREDGDNLVLNLDGLRYAGDQSGSHWLSAADDDKPLRVAPSPDRDLPAPARGSRYFAMLPPSAADLAALGGGMAEQRPGSISQLMRFRQGWLIGTNNGEWGGAFTHLAGSKATPLFDGNVIAAFRWGGRFYVVTGLQHMVLDQGGLVEVDLARLTVVRSIRLPAMPKRFAVSSKGAVVIETGAGDIAIRRDGTPIDPDLVSDGE